MTHRFFRFSLLTAAVTLLASHAFGLDYYVSPSGNDANAGTQAAPFKTIVAAQTAIRALKTASGVPAGGINVYLRAGYYDQAVPLNFSSADSGLANARITYAAYGTEEVFITGGVTIPTSAFSLVASTDPVWAKLDAKARGTVYQANLASVGLTDYGTLKPREPGNRLTSPMELFASGRPMYLAQWPNRADGWARTASAAAANKMVYSGDRPNRWTGEADLYLHGFWGYPWYDYYSDLTAIDTVNKTMTLAVTPNALVANSPYIAYNALTELDDKGEYYIDRTKGILYVYPTAPISQVRFQVSVVENPLVIMKAADYITFKNLTFEVTRGKLIEIKVGKSVIVDSCLLRNSGQEGAYIDATNSGLVGCEVIDTGEDGVRLLGGDRVSLTPAGNFVQNSRVHRAARIVFTSRPLVYLQGGVGNIVLDNLLDDSPCIAIGLEGNNHLIQGNEIRRVCQLTGDTGAIYTSRDYGFRGNIAENNFIHHIYSSLSTDGTAGIYLDNLMSSLEATNNVFYGIDTAALFWGGGRDNIGQNNIIARAKEGLYCSDYSKRYVNNTPGSNWNLLEKLSAGGIKYQSGIWASSYPELAVIPNDYNAFITGPWLTPQGCVFNRNVGWDNGTWTRERITTSTGIFSVFKDLSNNNGTQTPLFTEAATEDRKLRAGTLTGNATGFVPVPFASIGRDTSKWPAALKSPSLDRVRAVAISDTQIDLDWEDYSNMPANQETYYTVQRKNEPSGPWVTIATPGADTDAQHLTGLSQDTLYSFMITAYNAAGRNYVNPATVRTPPAPLVPLGSTTKYESETNYSILTESGTNLIMTKTANITSGKVVIIYDKGDSIRLPLSVPATGKYRATVRLRAGNPSDTTVYFRNGYGFTLDGTALTMTGDATTLSAYDPLPIPSYWGNMVSGDLDLTAGTHNLDVKSIAGWLAVDYVSLDLIGPPPIKKYSDWLTLRFAADQIADTKVSGPLVIQTSDGLSNLAKYALGLNPWAIETTRYDANVKVTTGTNGANTLQFTRSSLISDAVYTVEASPDGTTWTAIPQTSTTSGTQVTTRAVDPSPATNTYLRLKITLGASVWTSAAMP